MIVKLDHFPQVGVKLNKIETTTQTIIWMTSAEVAIYFVKLQFSNISKDMFVAVLLRFVNNQHKHLKITHFGAVRAYSTWLLWKGQEYVNGRSHPHHQPQPATTTPVHPQNFGSISKNHAAAYLLNTL